MLQFQTFRYLLQSFVLLFFITFLSKTFADSSDIINVALIYILPVVLIAIHGDMRMTLIVASISVILFNFLFVPPLYSFSVHNELYLWSFAIFIVVGWVITLQAKRLQSTTRDIKLKEMLLHIVSHDLRTPLAAIQGSITLLLSKNDITHENKKNLLEDIYHTTLRMNRLINNLLDSARLENDASQLKYEWCDFEDILGVVFEEFHEKEIDESIELHLDTKELYWGDNTLLTHLFINLLDNAFKYSLQETKIEIRIYSAQNHLYIEIFNKSDTIDPKELPNLFNKFYRLENANDIFGSGIGLAICSTIVKLHGGEIHARALNEGVLIAAKLPILKKAKI